MAIEYGKKTNAELVEILKSRSLSHTGKKADLVGRLQEDDKATAEKAAVDASAAATTAEPATTETTKVDAEDVIDWDDDDTTTVEPVTAKTTAEPTKAAPVETKNDATTTTEAPSATETPTVAPAESTPAEAPAKETESKAETTAVAKEGEPDSAQEPEVKPATDYTMGLSTTDYEAELAKRKARAAKFGIEDDSAIEQAAKAAERAKRFGTAIEGESVGVKGLDQPLSSDRPRKRGRGGDDEDGGRGGKRTDFGGRGRGRWGRRGHRNNNGGRRDGSQRNDNRPTNGNNKNNAKPAMSEQDIAAMEKRKARFATAA